MTSSGFIPDINFISLILQKGFLKNGCNDSILLLLTSVVSPRRRLFIHSPKALIVHLVSISGLSADNWSITPPPPPKSRNRRRRNTAMFRRRMARIPPLAKHGRAAFHPFGPNGVWRREWQFESGPAFSFLAHAQWTAAVT